MKHKERPDTVAGPGSRGSSTAADAEEQDAACFAAFGSRSQALGACCGHEGWGTAATVAPGRTGSCASCCPAPVRARTWSPSPCLLPSCTPCRENLHRPPCHGGDKPVHGVVLPGFLGKLRWINGFI